MIELASSRHESSALWAGFRLSSLTLAVAVQAAGQTAPWVVFSDAHSNSQCSIVNAANVQLVVLASTSELVSVTGSDTVFVGSVVGDDGSVFLNGVQSGFVDFETDGDGTRTLWWGTLFGNVVHFDTLTGDVQDSGLTPDQFVNVTCDACPFWDDQSTCTPDDSPCNRTTISVDIGNTSASYSTEGRLAYSNDPAATEADLEASGIFTVFTLLPGETVSQVLECDALQAMMLVHVELLVGPIRLESNSSVFHIGNDYACGDRVVFTLAHSEVLTDFAIGASVSGPGLTLPEYAGLQQCFAGSGISVPVPCRRFDCDGDTDVDLDDFAGMVAPAAK